MPRAHSQPLNSQLSASDLDATARGKDPVTVNPTGNFVALPGVMDGWSMPEHPSWWQRSHDESSLPSIPKWFVSKTEAKCLNHGWTEGFRAWVGSDHGGNLQILFLVWEGSSDSLKRLGRTLFFTNKEIV